MRARQAGSKSVFFIQVYPPVGLMVVLLAGGTLKIPPVPVNHLVVQQHLMMGSLFNTG
jgi:hypothetical protein